MKFKVGDVVVSKKLGLPTIMTIFGILDAKTFLANIIASIGITSAQSTNEVWEKHYPEWLDKYVYYAKYNSPQKPCSLQEYKESRSKILNDYYGYELNDEQIKKCYDHECKDVFLCTSPEDDLELFGD